MFDTAFSDSSHGEKAKARDLINALRILKGHAAFDRETLKRFPGFGCVALSIFPDPQTGAYKPGWEALGGELLTLLTGDEYASARASVFNAFYTSPVVIRAMYAAFERLGVPADAHVLEPGCGAGNFLSQAPDGMRFTGVELDTVSGAIARLIYPDHDIRIENFRDTGLPLVQAVIGNVPFAEISIPYNGHKFSLHDLFFAKSIDTL